MRLSPEISSIMLIVAMLAAASPAAGAVDVVRDGKARADIVVDTRGTVGDMDATLTAAGQWLAEAIGQVADAPPAVVDAQGSRPAIVLARGDQYPDAARRAGLDADNFDAFAIVTESNRVLLLGATEPAVRHAVAHLLHHWGYRYFNPMPAWWVVPRTDALSVDLTTADKPRLASRKIWYAYGVREPLLKDGYERWSQAMKLGGRGFSTGHSYGHIIRRNLETFDAHPEYYNLLPSGERNSEGHINARKFCVSNDGLINLVIEDRKKLLAEQRESNPYAYMVSVDPSDGEGTCVCENCEAIGTTTDRVFHLANAVARELAKMDPPGWVGLYAYSSHRMPATIDVEPNVYVQVAMGFNKTPYTLPQLIEKWAERVTTLGLREYYGVEAWDWGLPGRLRGARAAYHAKWIPYYADRNVNAINAETNANWGAQTLGLNVAAALMWNPTANVDAVADDYFTRAFGSASEPMRDFQARMDAAPPLRGATLLPLFTDLRKAYDASSDPAVRQRVIDLMSYAHYLVLFRQFQNIQSAEGGRNDVYYEQALKPLMQYAWQTRLRGMIHYYALARRLCNGLPRTDDRMDYYMFAKDPPPVWQVGEQLTDDEVIALFNEDIAALEADDDPLVVFSRYLEHVNVPGEDAGPSTVLRTHDDGASKFHRNGMTGYIAARGAVTAKLRVAPIGKQVTLTVKRRDDVVHEQTIPLGDEPTDVTIDLPRAGEYHVRFTGSLVLWVDASTPLVYEQSMLNRSQVEYSGPHYFYVPKGTTELIVEPGSRLSLMIPGESKRRDITPADCAPGKSYAIIDVPEGSDGTVWHTSSMTRGQFALLNVPPLLSFHRNTVIVPREIAEADGLVTADNR